MRRGFDWLVEWIYCVLSTLRVDEVQDNGREHVKGLLLRYSEISIEVIIDSMI